MTYEIVRELPPKRNGSVDSMESPRQTRTRDFAQFLKDHPGEWVQYPLPAGGMGTNSAYGTVSNIRGGRTATFRPAGSFDATARTGGDGITRVYVQYVGGVEEDT